MLLVAQPLFSVAGLIYSFSSISFQVIIYLYDDGYPSKVHGSIFLCVQFAWGIKVFYVFRDPV
jgi:hypothetical protein